MRMYLKVARVEDRVCSIEVHKPCNEKTKIRTRLKICLPLMEVSLNYTDSHNHYLEMASKEVEIRITRPDKHKP